MKWQRVNPGRLFHQAIGRHHWSFWLNSSDNPAEPVDLPSTLMQMPPSGIAWTRVS